MADQTSRLAPDDQRIIAYKLGDELGWTMEPASPRRDWMDKTRGKVAYRCLPLVMANQAGWVIRTPHGFSATWGGKDDISSITFDFGKAPPHFAGQVRSHFGYGIVTFVLPWVFRTPPGVGLLVRGPANQWTHHAHALEGLVETDWLSSPFTMNWRITARQKQVWFRPGDPVCVITPVQMHLLEALTPEKRDIADNPMLAKELAAFNEKRAQTARAEVEKAKQGAEDAAEFELDYIKGQTASGAKSDQHRTKLKLKPFV